MTKAEIAKIVEQEKIIAIVRGVEPQKCIDVAKALYDGGIRMMEITFNAKDSAGDPDTAACIGAIHKEFGADMLVGAGTVLNTRQVELTAENGGSFIISPNVNEAVIRRTNELGMLSMPGALTPTEIEAAHAAGAEFVKVFPVVTMGPAYIKAIRAPLRHIKMLAVGGINEKNLEDYLKAGVLGAGVGGNLANKEWVHAGEFWRITEVARQLTDIAKKFR